MFFTALLCLLQDSELKDQVRQARLVFTAEAQESKDGWVRVKLGAVLKHPENTDSEVSDQMDLKMAPLEAGKRYFVFAGEVLTNDPIRKLGKCSARPFEAKLEDRIPELVIEIKVERLIAEAELIIAGKVDSIKREEAPGGPLSEHDALMTLATIRVDSVLKGKLKDKSVSLSFSASRDVMWFQSPKFAKGDEGIWIMGKKREVLDPLRFHPKAKLDWIRGLLPKK